MAAQGRDWTSLPRDICSCILQKFLTFNEYPLFGRVCKAWSLAVKDQKGWRELLDTHVLLLIVPSRDGHTNRCSLYTVVNNKFCDLQISLRHAGRCCGSSHGRLATFGPDMVITLRNPFSGCRISLPRIFVSPPYYLTRPNFRFLDHSGWTSKVILCEDPSDSSPKNCIVGDLYERFGWLAFMRLSDEGWTDVQGGVEMKNLNDEVIFLGDNHSVPFKCSDIPGCKPDRIYFTDECFEDGRYDMQGPTDIGVPNVEEGRIETTYTRDAAVASYFPHSEIGW
ncbi:uncharacterized protein LOC116194049 [Punica granatum]|uniref:Uncharacterized protein LOC116194049 n=1 Tax=Punica granatum TaxID=22663 RepID=A0A6P8C840_PUNGR|nr:uncharacterized protein LOC116194049 [Punica granatum]